MHLVGDRLGGGKLDKEVGKNWLRKGGKLEKGEN